MFKYAAVVQGQTSVILFKNNTTQVMENDKKFNMFNPDRTKRTLWLAS